MGKRRNRFEPTIVSSQSDIIKPSEVDVEQKVFFNFCRLKENKKFVYKNRKVNYFLKLVERLKNISDMTVSRMTIMNRECLKCHKVNFQDDNVSENTFGLAEDVDDNAWQFSITRNKHGRVCGYMVDNCFFIVWLDPDHLLYPGK